MTGGTEVQYGGSRLGQDVLARQDRKKRIQKILTKYGVQSAGRVTGIPVTVGKGQLTLGKRVEKKQEGRSVVPYAQSAGIASNTAMPYAAGQQKAEIAPKRDPKPIEKPAAVLPDYFGKSAAELESMQEQTMGEKRELDRQIGALTCQGPYATKAGIVESTGTPYGAMAQATRESGYDYGRMKGFEERLEKARAYREGQEHTAQFAQEHPVLASGITILAGTIQGLDYFGQLLGNVGHNDAENLGSYVPLDVYDTHATNFVRTVRGTVAQKLEENSYLQTELGGQNVASFLYRTGMSMGDFLFNSMITGNFSGGLGGAGTQAAQKAASDLSLAIMGTGAASNATVDAIERGLSNREAYTLGAVAGMAELLTGKVSLDTLLDRTTMSRNAIDYLMRNVLAEGSEEVASDLINWTADVIVSRDRSEWRRSIRGYENQGYSEGEAFGLALKDQAMDMGLSFLGGAISGGIMAGGSVAVNGLNQYFKLGQTQKETVSGKETESTAINTDLQGHTPREQATIKEYKNAVDHSLLAFVERWQGLKDSNYKKKVRFTLGKVSQQTAQDIYTQLKINVSGYEHALSGNALQHIELRHGLDGATDQSMADPHDIARMGFVLENYDSVSPIYEEDGTIRLSKEYRNSDGSHAPLLQFQKRVDGTYYVVEAVPDSAAKQLRVVSAYMEKANGSTDRVLDMP